MSTISESLLTTLVTLKTLGKRLLSIISSIGTFSTEGTTVASKLEDIESGITEEISTLKTDLQGEDSGTTLTTVYNKVNSLDLELDGVAKAGENSGATNTAILEAVNGIETWEDVTLEEVRRVFDGTVSDGYLYLPSMDVDSEGYATLDITSDNGIVEFNNHLNE